MRVEGDSRIISISRVEPESEASREAILAQFLVGFGNILGRGPHRKQAGTHHTNEFAVLVGETSFGRKGTAWAAAEDLFSILDHDWLSDRVRDGFQSGEAIVHAVRDARTSYTGKRQVDDPGVADKRLQIMEDEFGRFLSIAARAGNTLSSMTRKAWDARHWLYVEGKIAPEKSTGAHISLIGHVTKSELLKTIFRKSRTKTGFPTGFFGLPPGERKFCRDRTRFFGKKIIRKLSKGYWPWSLISVRLPNHGNYRGATTAKRNGTLPIGRCTVPARESSARSSPGGR